MVAHHPETFPPPLVIGARLADHVAEHVVVGVFFLQAVPEHQNEPLTQADNEGHAIRQQF